MKIFSVVSGQGVFTNCVNRWCRLEGPTPPQYTKCEWISNHGRTCHYPEIKWGTNIGYPLLGFSYWYSYELAKIKEAKH